MKTSTRYTKAMRTADFFRRLETLGFTYSETDSLRLIEKTLQRWGELECGNSSDFASWMIERDTDSFVICSQGSCGEKSFVSEEAAKSGNCPKCGDCAPLKRHVATGKPYMVTHHYGSHGPARTSRHPVADREAGALRRAKAIVSAHSGLWMYHQGDPRGCALYVGRNSDIPEGKPLDAFYTRGVACCID